MVDGFADGSKFSLYYNYDFENEKGGQLILNKVGEKRLFEIPISEGIINSEEWHELEVVFDFKNNLLRYEFYNQKDSFRYNYESQNNSLNIIFGSKINFSDVPAFKIRDLELKDINNNFNFKLDQNNGEKVYNNQSSVSGFVKNPYWLIKDYYNWKRIKKIEFKDNYNVIFNERSSKFFLIGADDMLTYDVSNEIVERIEYSNVIQMNNFTTGNGFIDNSNNHLLYYQIKKDNIEKNNLIQKKLGINYTPDEILFNKINSKNNQFTVSKLNLNNFEWKGIYKNNLSEFQLFHHNSFFDFESHKLFLFNGYGDFKFHNALKVYDLKNQNLKSLTIKGDQINPRFYSAVNYSNNKKLFLYGGVGNPSGNESLGKQFYYDLYKLDFSQRKDTVYSKRLWSKKNEGLDLFNSESLFFTSDQKSFFVSTYKDINDKGYVKLKKIQIENGDEIQVGDSILINTSKLANKSNLFYSSTRKKFFFYTKEFNDNKFKSNKITFYSIEDDPITLDQFSTIIKNRPTRKLFYIFLIIGVVLSTLFILKRKSEIFLKRKKINHIYVRSDRSNVRIEIDDILAVEAIKDYVKIVSIHQNYLVHSNLSKFQKKLPSKNFIRVHRSFLINKNKITKIETELVYVGSKYYKIGGSYIKSVKDEIING